MKALLSIFVLFLVVCCAPAKVEAITPPHRGRAELLLPAGPARPQVGRIAVTIHCATQGEVRGAVVLLPGWKFSRLRWLNETTLPAEAERRGLCLLAPEMGVTLYESQYYPETRMRWSSQPGLRWLLDVFLPEMQARGLLRDGQRNYLLGLSTGGRGVALLSLAKPELWTAAAALSGDFDQRRMPRDRLMQAVYGPIEQFPERWAGADNPQQRLAEWKTPIYIAHGRGDRVVPFEQSERFAAELQRLHPALAQRFVALEAGHDFAFWSAQVPPVLDFFQAHSAN